MLSALFHRQCFNCFIELYVTRFWKTDHLRTFYKPEIQANTKNWKKINYHVLLHVCVAILLTFMFMKFEVIPTLVRRARTPFLVPCHTLSNASNGMAYKSTDLFTARVILAVKYNGIKEDQKKHCLSAK